MLLMTGITDYTLQGSFLREFFQDGLGLQTQGIIGTEFENGEIVVFRN